MTCNEIGTLVVDCAVSLHRETGPRFLEAVYEGGRVRFIAPQRCVHGFGNGAMNRTLPP